MASPGKSPNVAIVHQPVSHTPPSHLVPRQNRPRNTRSGHVPVLRDTRDKDRQTRFFCQGETAMSVMKRWRHALYVRYMIYLKESGGDLFSIDWEDRDKEENLMTVGDVFLDCSNPDIPEDLAKTFCQVHRQGVKLITITLYYKRRKTLGGTCLIQGNEKNAWVTREYLALCDYVKQLQEGAPHPADNVPTLLEISPATTIVTSSDTSPHFKQLLCQAPLVETPITTTQPRMTSDEDDTEVSFAVQPIVTEEVTSHASPSKSQHPEALTETTSSVPDLPVTPNDHALHATRGTSSQVDLANPSAPPSHSPSPPQTRPKEISETGVGPAPPPPGAANSNTANGDSPCPNPGAQTLPEPRPLKVNDPLKPLPSTTTVILPLRQLAAPLAARALSQLHTQLHGAFGLIGRLHNDINKLSAGLSSAMVKIDQLDKQVRDNAVKAANNLRVSEQCVDSRLSGISDKVSGLTEAHHTLQDKVSRLTSAKDSQGHVLRELKKQVDKQTAETFSQTPQHLTSPKSASCPASSEAAPTTDKIPPGIASPSPRVGGSSQTPHAVNTVNARKQASANGDPVSEVGGHRGNASTDTVSTTGQRTTRPAVHDAGGRGAPSPAEQVMRQAVQADTTTLLVGDSVLRYVRADKMSTEPQEKVQVISVSGLTTEHLCHWLAHQPVTPTVQLVTFHAGVNDCKSGQEVTTNAWETVSILCRHVFPNARLQASSILPAKGQHVMNNLITLSNASLSLVCNRDGISFIDHRPIFTAPSGAPRKALYRKEDRIHPSPQGTISLALHIKRGGRLPSPTPDAAGKRSGRGITTGGGAESGVEMRNNNRPRASSDHARGGSRAGGQSDVTERKQFYSTVVSSQQQQVSASNAVATPPAAAQPSESMAQQCVSGTPSYTSGQTEIQKQYPIHPGYHYPNAFYFNQPPAPQHNMFMQPVPSQPPFWYVPQPWTHTSLMPQLVHASAT